MSDPTAPFAGTVMVFSGCIVVAPGSIGIESSVPADTDVTGIMASTAIPEMNSAFAHVLNSLLKVGLSRWKSGPCERAPLI